MTKSTLWKTDYFGCGSREIRVHHGREIGSSLQAVWQEQLLRAGILKHTQKHREQTRSDTRFITTSKQTPGMDFLQQHCTTTNWKQNVQQLQTSWVISHSNHHSCEERIKTKTTLQILD